MSHKVKPVTKELSF